MQRSLRWAADDVRSDQIKTQIYVCLTGTSVADLLKEAGIKLFLRTSKGVQLTKEGELLYRYVKIGVESLLEGEKMVERVLGMDMGEVADWRQRYDPAVLPPAAFAAFP